MRNFLSGWGAVWSLCACLLVAPTTAADSISTADGSVIGFGGWSQSEGGFKIVSSATAVSGGWLYSYTVTNASDGGLKKDLSHLIIELCPELTSADLTDIQTTGGKVEFGTFAPPSSSNPGLPGSITGIKFDEFRNDVDLKFSFVSANAPGAANFYAKDGKDGGDDVYAYNSGFVGGTGFIVAPDCVAVPLPPAAWGGLALLGVLGGSRIRARVLLRA